MNQCSGVLGVNNFFLSDQNCLIFTFFLVITSIHLKVKESLFSNNFLCLTFAEGGLDFFVLFNFVQIFIKVRIRLSAQYLVALNIHCCSNIMIHEST